MPVKIKFKDSLKDYYQILQVNYDASTEEIKKAYRKLVVLVHPDKQQNNNNLPSGASHEEFDIVQEAFVTLSDPAKRKEYDIALQDSADTILEFRISKNSRKINLTKILELANLNGDDLTEVIFKTPEVSQAIFSNPNNVRKFTEQNVKKLFFETRKDSILKIFIITNDFTLSLLITALTKKTDEPFDFIAATIMRDERRNNTQRDELNAKTFIETVTTNLSQLTDPALEIMRATIINLAKSYKSVADIFSKFPLPILKKILNIEVDISDAYDLAYSNLDFAINLLSHPSVICLFNSARLASIYHQHKNDEILLKNIQKEPNSYRQFFWFLEVEKLMSSYQSGYIVDQFTYQQQIDKAVYQAGISNKLFQFGNENPFVALALIKLYTYTHFTDDKFRNSFLDLINKTHPQSKSILITTLLSSLENLTLLSPQEVFNLYSQGDQFVTHMIQNTSLLRLKLEIYWKRKQTQAHPQDANSEGPQGRPQFSSTRNDTNNNTNNNNTSTNTRNIRPGFFAANSTKTSFSLEELRDLDGRRIFSILYDHHNSELRAPAFKDPIIQAKFTITEFYELCLRSREIALEALNTSRILNFTGSQLLWLYCFYGESILTEITTNPKLYSQFQAYLLFIKIKDVQVISCKKDPTFDDKEMYKDDPIFYLCIISALDIENEKILNKRMSTFSFNINKRKKEVYRKMAELNQLEWSTSETYNYQTIIENEIRNHTQADELGIDCYILARIYINDESNYLKWLFRAIAYGKTDIEHELIDKLLKEKDFRKVIDVLYSSDVKQNPVLLENIFILLLNNKKYDSLLMLMPIFDANLLTKCANVIYNESLKIPLSTSDNVASDQLFEVVVKYCQRANNLKQKTRLDFIIEETKMNVITADAERLIQSCPKHKPTYKSYFSSYKYNSYSKDPKEALLENLITCYNSARRENDSELEIWTDQLLMFLEKHFFVLSIPALAGKLQHHNAQIINHTMNDITEKMTHGEKTVVPKFIAAWYKIDREINLEQAHHNNDFGISSFSFGRSY